MEYMDSEDFFNQPGVEFIREAWAAAKFAAARNADAVRLVAAQERWPDFEIRLAGQVDSWEFTEADVKRERGREYREGSPRADGDYIALIDHAPQAICSASARKAAKGYAGRAGLLIYLNIPSFGARQLETIESFPRCTASAKDAFREIWVLWKDRAYVVWQDGREAIQGPMRP